MGMLLTLSHCSPLGERTAENYHYFLCLSKPFTYALSLDQLGAEVVQKYIGREPSGRTFNEIAVDYNGMDIALLYVIVFDPRSASQPYD